MNLSNYPPGVTGNEPEIVGWHEEEEEHYCEDEHCEDSGVTMIVTVASRSAQSEEGYWECATCGTEYTVSRGPDPDAEYERWIDLQREIDY